MRKRRLVGEVNDLIGDAADTSRADWLEIAVIALIAVEIVAALKVTESVDRPEGEGWGGRPILTASPFFRQIRASAC